MDNSNVLLSPKRKRNTTITSRGTANNKNIRSFNKLNLINDNNEYNNQIKNNNGNIFGGRFSPTPFTSSSSLFNIIVVIVW